MSLYNDIARSYFPGATKEELNDIANNASDALEGILCGLESVGNVMYWASDNVNYSEKMGANAMRDIGEMLMAVAPIARALRDNAANAEEQIRREAEGHA